MGSERYLRRFQKISKGFLWVSWDSHWRFNRFHKHFMGLRRFWLFWLRGEFRGPSGGWGYSALKLIFEDVLERFTDFQDRFWRFPRVLRDFLHNFMGVSEYHRWFHRCFIGYQGISGAVYSLRPTGTFQGDYRRFSEVFLGLLVVSERCQRVDQDFRGFFDPSGGFWGSSEDLGGFPNRNERGRRSQGVPESLCVTQEHLREFRGLQGRLRGSSEVYQRASEALKRHLGFAG